MPEPLLAAGILDSNAPHRLGGRGEEVPAAVPLADLLGVNPTHMALDSACFGETTPKQLRPDKSTRATASPRKEPRGKPP
jgi:hypothetical protein